MSWVHREVDPESLWSVFLSSHQGIVVATGPGWQPPWPPIPAHHKCKPLVVIQLGSHQGLGLPRAIHCLDAAAAALGARCFRRTRGQMCLQPRLKAKNVISFHKSQFSLAWFDPRSSWLLVLLGFPSVQTQIMAAGEQDAAGIAALPLRWRDTAQSSKRCLL